MLYLHDHEIHVYLYSNLLPYNQSYFVLLYQSYNALLILISQIVNDASCIIECFYCMFQEYTRKFISRGRRIKNCKIKSRETASKELRFE